jgi:hypothetical protein
MPAVNPLQYALTTAELILGSGEKIDLSLLIMELSIYEDLFSPTMTGELIITDSQNFINAFNINGFNFIHFVFSKQDPDDPSAFDKYFRVRKIGERKPTTRSNQVYGIQFCSEELFISEQTKVLKSYQEYLISDIVDDILTTFLQVDDSKMGGVQTTKNTYNFIIPKMKPFEAINWLATYAQPDDESYPGADMLFYENRYGFNFQSLQAMMDQDSIATYTFDPQNVPGSTTEGPDTALNKILGYRFVDNFDSLKGISTGMFANKLISLDILTRTANVTVFNYDTYYDTGIHLNEYGVTTNYTNRFDQSVTDTSEAVLKMAVGNSQDRLADIVQNDSDTYATVAPDIGLETYVPYRTAQLAAAMYTKLEIHIPGNPALSVGDVIEIKIPSLANRPNDTSEPLDDAYSGYYLISALRHMLDITGTYVNVLELIKDSNISANFTYSDSGENTTAKVK